MLIYLSIVIIIKEYAPRTGLVQTQRASESYKNSSFQTSILKAQAERNIHILRQFSVC